MRVACEAWIGAGTWFATTIRGVEVGINGISPGVMLLGLNGVLSRGVLPGVLPMVLPGGVFVLLFRVERIRKTKL
jgi:hypothetical protein